VPAVVPSVELNNGVAIPQLGFGTYGVGQREVELALGAGYRSLDTATIYENEDGVGRAIAASGIPREELFVTTKVWDDQQGYDSTLRSFEDSRSRLDLDVVDLFLIHWPAPRLGLYVETWRALESLLEDGAVRAIGVSNFEPEHLDRLADETATVPALNQVELNPRIARPGLREYHAAHGIATEAWAPLARASDLLGASAVTDAAARHGKTPAQTVLRWAIELGIVAIPRSSKKERIEENFNVFDFELTAEEVERISALDRGPA
jgi:diketogulonate reductase-like aldo/keto reductase